MRNKKNGQALLIGIIIIFTASIALAVASALIASGKIGIAQNQKISALMDNMAAGCLENTLMDFSRGDFAVPADLITNGGTCKIEISGVSPDFEILATAEFNMPLLNKKATKKLRAEVTVSDGTTDVISLKEVY